ncbi:MAG: Zn-ribbon domain-containing OB-fold protein [Euryarchaeota archaeon]|nr:Zn-ribbon domain-containing OB-fold protein [Euryarchaeota archaeon]
MSGIPRFWRNIHSRYNLVGTRCGTCETLYFPPRVFCPKCRRMSKLEPVKLRGEGEVVTYTVIHTGPEGFDKQTPYIMAIVELDDGPRLTAQIVDCRPEDVEIGVFRKIQEDGQAGLIHYGFKFVPVKGS